MKKRKVLSLLLAGVVAMSSVVPVLGATTQEKIEAAQSEKAETQSNLAATQEMNPESGEPEGRPGAVSGRLRQSICTLTEGIEELTVKAGEKSRRTEEG